MARRIKGKKMDAFVAVFNQHINNADKKTEAALKKKFGEERFAREFIPFKKKGIMSIFKKKPTDLTMFYAKNVQKIVNKGKI